MDNPKQTETQLSRANPSKAIEIAAEMVSVALGEYIKLGAFTNARRCIDLLEAIKTSGMVVPSVENSQGLAQAEIEALARGDLIGAIKLYKTRVGCGLKEAKDAVVSYRDSTATQTNGPY